jgi:hypothetical protein
LKPPPVAVWDGLALTGDFAESAERCRQEAARLRAQAEALDVIADGIQKLAGTST